MVAEIGEKVAVAFEYIDYLHDLAVGLGGEIAEKKSGSF
jgi:hypothetical protein